MYNIKIIESDDKEQLEEETNDFLCSIIRQNYRIEKVETHVMSKQEYCPHVLCTVIHYTKRKPNDFSNTTTVEQQYDMFKMRSRAEQTQSYGENKGLTALDRII